MKTLEPRTVLRKGIVAAGVVAVLLALFAPAPAAQAVNGDEQALLELHNAARAAAGLRPLALDPLASVVATGWSVQLAATGTLRHNPNLVAEVSSLVTNAWTRLGENVGYGGSASTLHTAFMNSPRHRANIMGDYNRVGVGSVRDTRGRLWVTVVFIKGPAIASAPPPPPPPPPLQWYLRNATSGGAPDAAFSYGERGYQVLSCDWDGDGRDSIGVFVNGGWYLRNSNSGGAPDASFSYGAAGYVAVCGDWDGDGRDSVGVYVDGWWYLRNSNSGGAPDASFAFGTRGYRPVVGDWNADGQDSIGVFVNGSWYLRNSNTAGVPHIAVAYGAAGYSPVVGDWNGDGRDTIGVFVSGSWYLRDSNTAGAPTRSFAYGAAGYAPLAGDWDANGTDGVAAVMNAA